MTALDAAFTENDTKLGLRKAQKKTKRSFRKALSAAIGKINVAVKAKFGERAAEVKECFPEGRLIFSRCRDAVLESHLESLINGLQAHAAMLDPGVPAQAEALLASWRAVWETSGSASGVKAAAEAARREARRGLERELYLNLLALAQNYPLQPEKLAVFAQASLLLPHRHHPQKSSTPAEA